MIGKTLTSTEMILVPADSTLLSENHHQSKRERVVYRCFYLRIHISICIYTQKKNRVRIMNRGEKFEILESFEEFGDLQT